MPDTHRRDRTAAFMLAAGPHLPICLQAAQGIVTAEGTVPAPGTITAPGSAQGTVIAEGTGQGTVQGAAVTTTQAAQPPHAVAVLNGATNCKPA